ncbi:ABC transporter substrate-binding protein [Citrobacter freundii]|nr:ABC transporter substrate-binding protein [Citrobacter freundii]
MNWSLTPKVQGDVAAWFGSLPVVPEGCKASPLTGEKGCETNGYSYFDKMPSGKRRLPKVEIRSLQSLDAGLHRHYGWSLIPLGVL